MFKFLKSNNSTEVLEKTITSKDIQDDMLSQLDFILGRDFSPAEYKIEEVKESNKELIATAAKLRQLGFSITPSVTKSQELKNKIHTKQREISLEKEEVKLTAEYAIEYPGYKFVPNRIFDEVCEKYDLYTALPERYIKEIPTKNVNDTSRFIENFGVVYQKINITHSSFDGTERIKILQESKTPFEKPKVNPDFSGYVDFGSLRRSMYSREEEIETNNLEITAPISHFNLKNSEVKNRKINTKVEDPIISRPVKGGRIIVTVWDKEAEIPEINNLQILN